MHFQLLSWSFSTSVSLYTCILLSIFPVSPFDCLKYTDGGVYTCSKGGRSHSIPGSYGHYNYLLATIVMILATIVVILATIVMILATIVMILATIVMILATIVVILAIIVTILATITANIH